MTLSIFLAIRALCAVLVEPSFVNELLEQPAEHLRLRALQVPPPPYLQHDIVVTNQSLILMAPKRKRLLFRRPSAPKSPARSSSFQRSGSNVSNVSDSSQKSQSQAKLVLSPSAPGQQLFFGVSRSDEVSETLIMPKREDHRFWCDVCAKSFASRGGLAGHQSSKAHLEKHGLKSKQDLT